MNLKKKFALLSKNFKFKKLTVGNVKRSAGRNYSGKKTIRNRGFITKQKKRIIDHFRAFWHVKFCILNFESNPSKKNSLINLVLYNNGVFSYILAIEGVRIGTFLENGLNTNLFLGNNILLIRLKKNMKISNLEFNLFKGSQIARNSFCFSKILNKKKKNCFIKLKSKKIKKVNVYCSATIGSVFGFDYYFKKYKKASFNRLRGFKPKVRGVAMNPVDHPHGGGEGKKSKKVSPMTPWGKKLNFKKKF